MKLPQTFRPEKDLEQNVKTLLNPKKPVQKPVKECDPIWLEDVYCTFQDDSIDTIECYDKIFIKTGLATTNKNRSSCFTLQGAVSFFERQKGDVFLPSSALTCNILAKLYELRHYEEVENLLLQYSNHGLNDGWHLQNTIIDWKGKKIIHFPGYSEVPKKIKKREMNHKRNCTILEFNLKYCEDAKLEFLLKEHNMANFIKNLTGLRDPGILVEIGDYFRKPTMVWFPEDLEKSKLSTVWIGGRQDNFDIYLASGISYSGPARGVYTEAVKKKK